MIRSKNLTAERLDSALRLSGIEIHKDLLKRVVDVIILVEQKGGKTSINDISDLQVKWRNELKNK